MKTKTCGECHFYEHPAGQCSKVIEYNNCHITDKACEYFEPKPTIGDKIRQMSNTELAEMLVYPVKPMNINGNIHYEFTSCLLLGKSYPMREQAVFLTEKRLNAPAESEVEDE